MATQYIILRTAQRNDESTIVVHTETPVGNNEATPPVPWSQALIESIGTPVTSLVPASVMPAGRQTELDVGTRFEWSFKANYDANDTAAAKLVVIEAQIATEEVTQLAEGQNRLRLWGQTGAI